MQDPIGAGAGAYRRAKNVESVRSEYRICAKPAQQSVHRDSSAPQAVHGKDQLVFGEFLNALPMLITDSIGKLVPEFSCTAALQENSGTSFPIESVMSIGSAFRNSPKTSWSLP